MDNQTPNQQANLNTLTPTLTPVKVETPAVKDLGHDKLMPCLYFVFDAFSRGQAQFFLVRQTAKDAIAGKQLSGDQIHIGVRKNEWFNGNSELILPYFDNERVEKKLDVPEYVQFEWQGIPFTMHLYDDNPCVMALIPVAYEYENWNIPNQFERFCKEFDNET